MQRPRFLMAFLLVLLAALPAAAQETLSIQVREAPLRESPSFLGRVAATLAYGDRVVLEGEQGDFKRVAVQGGGPAGWVHASAVSEKEIVLTGGGSTASTQATGDEIALAGKGFNRQVEEQYRQRTGLDYATVDRMEGITVSTAEMAAFLEQGGVTPRGGM